MTPSVQSATAVASPNIAFIKYWGNQNQELRLPSNGSISMTLAGLRTRTSVSFELSLAEDRLTIDAERIRGDRLARVSAHLDRIREIARISTSARVVSDANFPMSAGLASSASAFAALTLAATTAAGLKMDQKRLSRLARLGSGSASRSIHGGFVEWYASDKETHSYAEQIAPPDHWDLVDIVAVVSRDEKKVTSTVGHTLADTSPLQLARVADTARRLEICREAIMTRNFPRLASIVEQDSNMMHAVMLTSTPPLLYWNPATMAVIAAVASWRDQGLQVCQTVDAGPNVHCICSTESAEEVAQLLGSIKAVADVIQARPGEGARLIEPDHTQSPQ